jgi:hypothetical protein
MSEGGALINLGELSKPATVLVEKISEAIGGIFRPYQIRRVAQAEAEAEKIRVVAEIEVTDLQRRAMVRVFAEEAKKQVNIESITSKALPAIDETASPQDMEDDWITNFFDKCRLISDDEMQVLWSKVLAGEANSPGRYSKRTVNFLASLDKADAEMFRNLCSFGWVMGDFDPLIYDPEGPIYVEAAITFDSLKHLDQIGLISFESLSGYRRMRFPQKIVVAYYGALVEIKFALPTDNQLEIGQALLSKVGHELAPICGSQPRDGFKDYVLAKWRAAGYKVREIESEQSVDPHAELLNGPP